MSQTLANHPFSFVLNRTAKQDFRLGTTQVKKGDTIWMFTVPGQSRLDRDEKIDFGINFGLGQRSCVG